MARGLAIPVGVDGNGRARVVSGDDYIEQLIGIALSRRKSSNPFEAEGIDNAIHSLEDDRVLRTRIGARVAELFSRLKAKKMARLLGDPIFFFDDRASKLMVIVTWISLETEIDKVPTRSGSRRSAYYVGEAVPVGVTGDGW